MQAKNFKLTDTYQFWCSMDRINRTNQILIHFNRMGCFLINQLSPKILDLKKVD